VIDSTGKTPDGILADVAYYCDLMDRLYYPNYCEIVKAIPGVPDILTKDFIIPAGNTIAFGSFEG